MPDFDKNLRPKLENPDIKPVNLDNPIVKGREAFLGSQNNLANKSGDTFDQVFGPYKDGLAPTVSSTELYENRRYGRWDATVEDIEDQKAYAQTFGEKAANGLLKGLNLTATTVAGGFGMLGGLAISPFTGRLADIWDNQVTSALDRWNNEVDQNFLPNYQTNIEKNAAWYSPDYWFKTNFLFNDLIKNSGFAVGAMISGNIANAFLKGAGAAVGSAAMRGAQAAEASQGFRVFTPLLRNTARAFSNAKNIEAAAAFEKGINSLADIEATSSALANIAKTTNAIADFSDIGRRSLIAVYSSAGESAWEALGTGNEYRNKLIEEYKALNGGQEPMGTALEQINSEADKVGRTSFFANMALLAATEYTQLGKLMGSSYSAERQAANALIGETDDVLVREGKYIAKPAMGEGSKFGRLINRAAGVGRYIFDPKEGFQEVGQLAIQTGSQNYYNKAKLTDAASLWTDGFLYGMFDENQGALYSNEGGKSFLLGGLTGGPMQARANYVQSKAKASNTEAYLNMINNAPSAREAFKSRLDSANRGVVLQEEHEQAVKEGNKLEAMDRKSDIAFNYLYPRVKYGRLDMVMEDFNDIRQDLYSNNGLAKVKEQGLASLDDTVQDVEARLNQLEKTAKQTSDIYRSLQLRYGGAVNEQGQRIYSDDVLEQMAYATHKITDYDNRLIDLSQNMLSSGINATNVKEALYQSAAWQEGRIDDAVREEGVTKAITESVANINNLDATDDVKEELKTNFADFLEIALRRKSYIEEYNKIKEKPQQYQQADEDYKPEFSEDEKVKAATEGELPEETITIKTKKGERKYALNTPYLVGKVVDYDDEGHEVYRAPEITILGENEDGTLKIKLSDGTVKDIKKDILEKYNLGSMDAINKSTTAKYFYNHWNDVFKFNFGKKYGGEKSGRLRYNPDTNELFFVYKDAKGQVKEKKVTREHFVAQTGYDKARLRVDRTLAATTTAAQQAEKDFLADEERAKEKEELTNAKNKDARLQVIKEMTEQTKQSLEDTKKKLVDKQEQLQNINESLESLREQRVGEPTTKKEKARVAKYPELSRHEVKFKRVFTTTTDAIIKLSRLKQATEEEVASLAADIEELEFNLSYMEDFGQNLEELPTDTREFVKELNEQKEWLNELIVETGKEMNVLAQLAKDIDSAIKEFVKFLKDTLERFNKDYPSYLRDSLERMLQGKGLLSEIDVVKQYKEDVQLLGDTEKEIFVKEKNLQDIETKMNTLRDTMKGLEQELKAKSVIADRFQAIIDVYDKAKAEEEALLKDQTLQAKFFNDQKTAQAFSGEETEEPMSEEDIEEANKAMVKFIAAKPATHAFSATIVSSESTRPSDIRHGKFLENINTLPVEHRSKLRRMYVAKGNQKALQLENEEGKGIIEEHMGAEYNPTEKDDKLIVAIYVTQDADGLFYVDQNGNKLQKVGTKVDDYSQLVWASMPRPTEKTDRGFSRFNDKVSEATVNAYIAAYKEWRNTILAQTDTITTPEAFEVSKGVTKKTKGKNYIVGSLVSKQDLETDKPVLIVSTKGVISHNGIDIVAPKGRTYIQNGNILEPVYNRNLTDKEVNTVFEALKEFVRKANATKTFDKDLTRFLQGILYFSSPYKTQEGAEVKGRVGRNQFYFKNGSFYFGEKEVEIPFTVDSLETNKDEVKAFLKGTYNNINTYLLNQNKPFTEFRLNEEGQLEKKEWKSYQQYLLSDEGRTAEEVPLSTTVVTPSNDIPGDTIYQPGSLYSYNQDMLKVDVAEEKSPVKAVAPEVVEEEEVVKDEDKMTEEEYIKENNIDLSTNLGRMMLTVFRNRQAVLEEEKKKETPAQKAVKEEKPKRTQTTPSKKLTPVKNAQGDINQGEIASLSINEVFKKKEIKQMEDAPEPKKDPSFNAEETKAKLEKPDGYDDQQYRVVGAYNYAMANVEAERDYIKKNSPFSVSIIDNLIAAGNGLYAWGSYKESAITLSRLMEEGTGYHEFFEGVFDVFLDNKERERILIEFSNREGTFIDRETGKPVAYKDATIRQAKEQMAEEFRDKKLYDKAPPKANTNFIVKFFEDLLKFIDSILTGRIKNIDDLFSKMDAGYYKNAAFKRAPTTQTQFRLDNIGNLDPASTSAVVKHVVSKVFRRLFTSGRADVINSLDFSGLTVGEVYKAVFKDLEYYYQVDLPARLAETTGMTRAQYDTQYGPIIEAVLANWDTVKRLSGEFLMTFKVLQDLTSDKESEDSDYGGRNAESYMVDEFMYDGKKNAPASIKLLIATLNDCTWKASATGQVKISDINNENRQQEVIKDEVTQLNRMVDYARMFNYTLSELASANTMKEKEDIIKNLANTNPNFVAIKDYLKIDKPNSTTKDEWSLKIKWYNTFAKQRPVALINYIQADGTVTIGEANLRDAKDALTQDWLSRAKNNSRLVTVKADKFVMSFGKIGVQTNTTSGLYKFLHEIGIPFSPTQIQNISSTDLTQLRDAVNSLKTESSKREIIATTVSTTKLGGTLDKIFTIYIKSKNLAPEATSLNINGKPVQEYIQTNAVSRMINDINNATSLQDLYQRLPYLAGQYSQDSAVILESLFPGGVRSGKKLTIGYVQGTIDTVERDNIDITKLTESQRLMQGINQNLAGNYYVLLPADGQTEYLVMMENRYNGLTQEALDKFWEYYNTEQALPNKSATRLFNFMENGITDKAEFENKFKEFIDAEVNGQMKLLMDSNVLIDYDEKETIYYKWGGLYKNYLTDNSYTYTKLTADQVKEILTYRTVNFMANNTEIQKLFFGDPGAYEDATKRYKSFLSPREQSLYDAPEYNAFANANFNKAGKVQLNPTDPGYQWFGEEMRTATLMDNYSSIKGLNGYDQINTTDGQAIATLPAIRQMLKKNGDRWTDKMEQQFQYDMALDRLNMAEDGVYDGYKNNPALQKHDQNLINKGNPMVASLSPLKPVVSGFDGVTPILDKYSIYGVSYTAARGTNMAKLYKRMLDDKLDYVIFESGRKVGKEEGKMDSVYDENGDVKTTPFNPDAIINVPFKWFGIQVETQSSKDNQTFGTQLGKLATINLMSSGVPVDYKGTEEQWNRMTFEERKSASNIFRLVAKERELRKEMIQEGYNQLIKKLGITDNEKQFSVKKLLNLIKDEVMRRGINDNLKEALAIDPNTNDFLVPLEALTNYESVKSLIYSYVDKYIASPKVSGGGKIQVSGTAWEMDGKRIEPKTFTKKGKTRTVYTHAGLKFYENEDGKRYMEVYMPFWFGEKLRRAGVDLNTVKIEDLDPEILTGVGFRIPTQELNSVEVFKVKGFLPQSMGNMVVVPEAITTKAGSDFDVDKLFTYLKNVYVNRSGKIKMVPYLGLGDAAKKKLGILDFIDISVKPDASALENISPEDFDPSDEYTVIDKMYKQSIENEYFKTLEELLTLPDNFNRLVTPNSSKELQDLRDELVGISEDEFGEGAYKTVMSPTFMNKIRHNYLLGKGGVGIGAVSQTTAALTQKANVIIDPERIKKLADKTEREYIKDGFVKLPSNKVTVNGKEYSTISGMFDVAKRYISDKISQYINGFVDVAKDSFLVSLGVNKRNAGTFLLLERLGVPSDIVVYFMNQPIIREAQKIMEKNEKTFIFDKEVVSMIKANFPSDKEFIPKDFSTQDTAQLAALLKSNISAYYKDGKKKLSAKDNAFQQFILNEYLKYRVIADNLFRFNQSLNYDTANINSPWLVEMKLLKTQDAQENNVFSSIKDVLDKTYMGDMMNTVVKASEDISNSFFLFLNQTNQQYLSDYIKELVIRRDLSVSDFVKVARKLEQSFINFLSQNKTGLNNRIKALAIDAETAVATQVQQLKNRLAVAPNSTLARNPIIERLTTENIDSPLATRVVKLFDKSTDVFTQNTLIDAMMELKNNPATEELYENLVRIGFIQSGIATSRISFLDIVPVEDYKKLIMPAIEALADKDLLLKFRSSGSFQRNNWRDPNAVARIKEIWRPNFYSGEYEVKNRYRNKDLDLFAKSVGIDNLYAYTVNENDPRSKSRYITVKTGRGANSQIVLLRRLDLVEDEQPYLTAEDKNNNRYTVYTQVNAWGDGVNGQEHYTEPRRSVYNNGTVQTDNELSNEQVLGVVLGTTKVAPVVVTPAPTAPETLETSSAPVQVVEKYTIADLKANPNKIYVFGDNTERKGTGGQAQIRGNVNAMGIATKLKPTNAPDAFMSDSQLEQNKQIIDSDIAKIKATNKIVVLPKNGLGTGLAKLKEKAPKTFSYLNEKLQEEFGFNNNTGELTTFSTTAKPKLTDAQIKLTKQYKDWVARNANPMMTDQENLDYYKKCVL